MSCDTDHGPIWADCWTWWDTVPQTFCQTFWPNLGKYDSLFKITDYYYLYSANYREPQLVRKKSVPVIEQYSFQQFPKSWQWQTEVSEFSRQQDVPITCPIKAGVWKLEYTLLCSCSDQKCCWQIQSRDTESTYGLCRHRSNQILCTIRWSTFNTIHASWHHIITTH